MIDRIKLRSQIIEILRESADYRDKPWVVTADRIIKLMEKPEESEPVYEIEAFRDLPSKEMYYRRREGVYSRDSTRTEVDIDILLNSINHAVKSTTEIYSVKRLSDSEILIIGDKIESSISKTLGIFTITGFKVNQESAGGLAIITTGKDNRTVQIAITCAVKYAEEPKEQVPDKSIEEILWNIKNGYDIPDEHSAILKTVAKDIMQFAPCEFNESCEEYEKYGWRVEPVQEPKKVLLTTEDRKELYNMSDVVYAVDNCWEVSEFTVEMIHHSYSDRCYKWFSTPATRDEYILNNRPLFSIAELRSMDKCILDDEIVIWEGQLKQVAKDKINK